MDPPVHLPTTSLPKRYEEHPGHVDRSCPSGLEVGARILISYQTKFNFKPIILPLLKFFWNLFSSILPHNLELGWSLKLGQYEPDNYLFPFNAIKLDINYSGQDTCNSLILTSQRLNYDGQSGSALKKFRGKINYFLFFASASYVTCVHRIIMTGFKYGK